MIINGVFRCAKCLKSLNDNNEYCTCGFDNGKMMNPSHCLPIGTILSDSYVVGSVIGVGGFGITYVGWDKDLDIKIAIKEFFLSGYNSRNTASSCEVSITASDSVDFEEYREKYIKEAKIMAALIDEPGIVNVYKFFRANNTAYIVMQYIEGTTLKEYLARRGQLSVGETMNLMLPIMRSLAKVHDRNLIHRDISPDNIMIMADGQSAKLIDFGAAREVSSDNKSMTIILKHGYAPIEQYQSKGNQGPWTDVYALCATMYRCICGGILQESVDRLIEDQVRPLCELIPSCNRQVSDVIMFGLGIKPEDRFQTVGALINALEYCGLRSDQASSAGLSNNQSVTYTVPYPGAVNNVPLQMNNMVANQPVNQPLMQPLNQDMNQSGTEKKGKRKLVFIIIAILLILIFLCCAGGGLLGK